jgi:CBS domain-containing protein
MPTAYEIVSKRTTPVATVSPDATVMDAAKTMSDQHIGSMVVMSGDKIMGMFTERDVLNRVVAKSLDPAKTIIKDVMTSPVAYCKPSSKLSECRSVMTEKRIRHLPVVEDGKLLGMISSGDIMALEHREQQQTIEYMHDYMHGPGSR